MHNYYLPAWPFNIIKSLPANYIMINFKLIIYPFVITIINLALFKTSELIRKDFINSSNHIIVFHEFIMKTICNNIAIVQNNSILTYICHISYLEFYYFIFG